MTDTDLLVGQTWQELLARRSFIELDALGRATALLDPGSAAGARRALRPAGVPVARASGHHAAGRRRHRHRPRKRRRPSGRDRLHRAGLPGRWHRRGVRGQDLPGAAACRCGLAGRHADRRGDPVRDRRRPAAGSQSRPQRRRRDLFSPTGSAPLGAGDRRCRRHRRIVRRDEHRRGPVHPAHRHAAGPHRAQRARRHRAGRRHRRIRLQRPRADLGGRRRRAALRDRAGR